MSERMTEGEIIMARHIFITGQPGVGKTTLVVAAVRACQDVCGFYTAERRSGSERSGFDVVALSPSASVIGTLATVGKGKYMVGKYSVDVPSFESIALPSLKSATATPITVIDEVGKMELFSQTFLPLVESILDGGAATVLGTLPMPRYGHKIAAVEAIRERPDVAVVKLSRSNRDAAAKAVQLVVAAAVSRAQPGALLDVSPLVDFLEEGQMSKLGEARRGREAPAAAHPPLLPLLPAPPLHVRGAGGEAQGRAGGGGARGGGGSRHEQDGAAAAAEPLMSSAPRALLLGETASAAPAPGDLPYADRSMWPVLQAALGLPSSTALADTQTAALEVGVAVWDVLANVHEQVGRKRSAAHAETPRYNDVPSLLRAHPTITRIGFIGAKAKATYERGHGGGVLAGSAVTLHVLPSSSRANTQPLATKAAAWRQFILGGPPG